MLTARSNLQKVVDGDFVPALPGQLLLEGQFDKSLRIMTGHNLDEGILFTTPFAQTEPEFEAYIISIYPTIPRGALDYIGNTLYPPVFDGSYGYKDPIGRLSMLVGEAIFTCNTNYLARAYNNQTYGYVFAIPPSVHGQDIA